MATGPEHYREAERPAERAHHYTYGDGADVALGHALAAEAQVHATLALAAATALNSTGIGEADLGEWTALICEPEPTDAEDKAREHAEAFGYGEFDDEQDPEPAAEHTWQVAAEETARVGTPDVYVDFATASAVAADVMRTLSDMGLPLYAFKVERSGVSIQHTARFGDDAARLSLRAVSDRLGIDYRETTDLSSPLGGTYTSVEACGPIGGVQVSVWNHADRIRATPAQADDVNEDSPIPYVLAEQAGEEDFANGYLAAVDDSRYTTAQLIGDDCAVCGAVLAEGQPTVPTGFVIEGEQLLAHAGCAESEAAL